MPLHARDVGPARTFGAGAAFRALALALLVGAAAASPAFADPPGGSVQAAHAPAASVTVPAATPVAAPKSPDAPKATGTVVAPAAPATAATATTTTTEKKPKKTAKSGRDATGKKKVAKATGATTVVRSGARATRRDGDGPSVASIPAAAAVAAEPAATADAAAAGEAGTAKAGKKKSVKTAALGGVAIPAPDADESPVWGGDDLEIDPSLGAPTLSARNVEPMKAAIARYSAIVAQGGWDAVPMMQMEKGLSHPAVEILRRRLEIEGDLPKGSAGWNPAQLDYTLSQALERFQIRNGLKPTGDLTDKDLSKNGTRTLNALNVPAAARLQQLRINLERIQALIRSAAKRYVLVNIPAQQVEAVSEDRVELRLAGVVGKPERPSPLLTSTINQLKFNPLWTLPPTVVKEDLIPKGRKMQAKGGVDVLTKFGIDAYGAGGKLDPTKINWNAESVYGLRFSQQPGKENPLGFVKIDFPSPHSVYMHDTPSPRLFEKAYRAASSGCIRVQHVEKLAAWLLRGNEGWSLGRVLSMKETGETEDVSLKKPTPLYWVYITAWADENGVVYFRRDLYKKDVAQGVHKLAAAY